MTLTPRQLHAAVRAAARKGGSISAERKRERKRRYLAGEMEPEEKVAYEAWMAQNRENGRRGGWPRHKANRAKEDAAT